MVARNAEDLLARLQQLHDDADDSGWHVMASALMLIRRGFDWPKPMRHAALNMAWMTANLIDVMIPHDSQVPPPPPTAGV